MNDISDAQQAAGHTTLYYTKLASTQLS